MDIVRFAITKPVTIIVGIIFVLIFGFIGLDRMPYQLSPTVVEPVITVTTTWRGATPYEMEREITERQEETLKGIPGLKELESNSRDGRSEITLTFRLGTNLDDALLRVSNKVNEVRGYPDNADKPVISATGAATSPVIWMTLKTEPDNPNHIDTYKTFFEDEVRQYLERVEGVADLFIGAGRAKEMHIIVDPVKLAAYQITVGELVGVLGAENVDVSSGDLDLGRRNYRIRTTGEFNTPEEIENVVIRSTGQQRVRVSDVATIMFGYEKKRATVIHNQSPAIAIGIKPEPGTNILDLTNRVEEVYKWLNENKLKEQNIHLEWVYDQRFYINSAIDLIKQNILVGGLLAVVVLLVFLRSVRSTLVVGMGIPISIIGTFVFMWLMGRNLNVVSMAGIAFAVGMLVDNAIVVIENIDRHRKELNKSPFRAAYDGTQEVWGAVLASTLTTIAVFLPVVFIEEEAGQLFRDIAIAVVSAVSLSLIVSISVIPMFARKLLRGSGKKMPGAARKLGGIGGVLQGFFVRIVGAVIHNWATRLATIGILTMAAVLIFSFALPQKEYLPQGNRNFILTILIPPPGLSTGEIADIGDTLFDAAAPHMGQETGGIPSIRNMFFVGTPTFMISGAMSDEWDRARELIPLFQRTVFTIPGMIGVSQQVGIFQTRIGGSNNVDVDISGADINQIVGAAGMMFGKLTEINGKPPRPIPSIELQYPEVNIVPDRERLKANGLSARDLGIALDVMMDGRDIGDFKEEGKKKIDLILKGAQEDIQTPEELYHAPVVNPRGNVVPVSSLASLERDFGITQIRHLERNRTITLQVAPPEGVPLQQMMETIENDVVTPMREQDMLEGMTVRMSGAAEKLVQTWGALKWNFVLAALIAYLLMAALFGNFLYPLIIMFTVPLAGAGGVLGLRVLNLFQFLAGKPVQSMDILTMLGFVILIGIVVNNAILIVHQSLNNVRGGMEHREAVLESVRTRVRPIYMSASTSIFGMLPLVVFPGAGSELYSGLGSVIIGGIAVSTIFTVFIIPSLLMFAIKMEKPGSRNEEDD